MPSPAMLHGRADRASIQKTYPDLAEFWSDLTTAYRQEIQDLYAPAAVISKSTTPRLP
jgi:methionine synthase II (cobalamin-independent)